jgi:hypothetical protein
MWSALTLTGKGPTFAWFALTFQRETIFHVKVRAFPVREIISPVKVCSHLSKENCFPRQGNDFPRQGLRFPFNGNHFPRQGLF